MASYHYLIPSLPELQTDGEMPISYEEFLSYCKDTVEKSVYEDLKALTLSSDKGAFVRKWAEFYQVLTTELNYQRSLVLGVNYPAPKERNPLTSSIVKAALDAKNPLEGEKLLLSCEFEALDALMGMHMFDKAFLFGYAIKLRLLERQSCFDKDTGKAEFKSLFEQVQQHIYSL